MTQDRASLWCGMSRRISRPMSRRGCRLIMLVILALAGSLPTGRIVQAAPDAAPDSHPVVVELFTSQGCSSCPPADRFLGKLAGRPDVLALAWHVDYWDYIGWADPFASSENTARQRRYGRALGLSSIYTPQMVLDGTVDAVGSRTREVSRKIAQRSALPAAERFSVPVSLTRDGDMLALTIDAAGATGAAAPKDCDLWAVVYDTESTTEVQRGENAGKTLTEYNIVQGSWRLGSWTGAAMTQQLSLGDLPVAGDRLAVLVQARGQGAIWGAATAALR